jgi:hypothetical protein
MPTLRDVVDENVREGDLYERLDRSRVRCFACGHCCPIPEANQVSARFATDFGVPDDAGPLVPLPAGAVKK